MIKYDSLCSGCLACFNICNHKAISLNEDKLGFIYPSINSNCINCSLCDTVCQIHQPILSHNIKECFAAWSKNKTIRKASSSGGIFSEIAISILNNNGIVYGVSLDNKLNCIHIRINNPIEIVKLQQSKYTQSYIGYIYKDVKKDLKSGRFVLFSGTPCQIDGLKRYLNHEYDNLFLIDILCHGVPSPKVFDHYKTFLEQKNKAKLTSIKFRDKRYSWKFFNMKYIYLKNNRTFTKYGSYYTDPYIRGFLSDIYLRESCYNCKFVGTKRTGDITLGDFWGYDFSSKEKNYTEKGISMVLINTEKGNKIFNNIKDQLVSFNVPLEEAIKGNKPLTSSFSPNPLRQEFIKDLEKKQFTYLINKYMSPKHITVYDKLDEHYLKNELTRHTIKIIKKIYTAYWNIKYNK